MSNLSDAFSSQKDALNIIGGFVGLAADFSGAIGGVLNFIQWATGESDQVAQTLNEIVNELNEGFQSIHADLRAEDILARKWDLDLGTKDAEQAFATLYDDLAGSAGLSDQERRARIEKCFGALLFLGADDKWQAVADDQFDYQDNAFGKISPPVDSNGLVFSYAYILPAYMRFVFIFLVVGQTLESDFAHEYTDLLREIANLLQSKHDKILQSIVSVPEPKNQYVWFDLPTPVTEWQTGYVVLHQHAEGAKPGAEYGAVDPFSTYNSVAHYPLLEVPGNYPEPSDDWFNRFFARYRLRTLKKKKDVYAGIGLPAVWETINHLRALVGDPPLPEANFANSSLREAFAVLRYPNNPLLGEKISVRSLANFLNALNFYPPQQNSLRQLLYA
jgi:hypothetical protein